MKIYITVKKNSVFYEKKIQARGQFIRHQNDEFFLNAHWIN